MGWSCDAGQLAACFTGHSRDLFGYACVLSGADRALAGDLVQAAFEAAATAWCTLGGLPADQFRHWLREKLAAEAQGRAGHPAGSGRMSPSVRRLPELTMARYRPDYDAAAGLDRFAGWLRTRADGTPTGAAEEPPGQPGTGSAWPGAPSRSGPGGPPPCNRARLAAEPWTGQTGRPGLHLARLHALPGGTPASSTRASSITDGARASGARANGARANGAHHDGAGRSGATGDGTTHSGAGHGSAGHGWRDGTSRIGAAAPSGSDGDPVSALYEQHYASLVRLAALLVRDTATAEVIVQDSFVAVAPAWRRRGDVDGALDFLRQSVLDRSRSALRHGIPPASPAGGPAASTPLLAALGALPARQREVLVLRYYANLSEEQAADTIGISRAAVRRLATLANAALRTLLDTG